VYTCGARTPPSSCAGCRNVYKRARLGNRVKWALKEAGYPQAFADTFTYELVRVVTLAAKSPRP
jgi:hypothetical protein